MSAYLGPICDIKGKLTIDFGSPNISLTCWGGGEGFNT